MKHYDCVENHKYVPWHIPNIQLDAGLNLTKVVNSSCLTFSKKYVGDQTDSLNNYKCTALTSYLEILIRNDFPADLSANLKFELNLNVTLFTFDLILTVYISQQVDDEITQPFNFHFPR